MYIQGNKLWKAYQPCTREKKWLLLALNEKKSHEVLESYKFKTLIELLSKLNSLENMKEFKTDFTGQRVN